MGTLEIQTNAFRTSTGWTPESDAFLVFEFAFYGVIPYLSQALSTADPNSAEILALLFDAVRRNPVVFKPTRNSLSDQWLILHEEPDYILEPTGYGHSREDCTVRRQIEA